MTKLTRLLGIGALGGLSILYATGVAAEVTGRLWQVPEDVSENAIVANVPTRAPDVVFTVNSPLHFYSGGGSVANWLASGGAFNIVEMTAGTLASPMGATIDGVETGALVEFTGSVAVTHGQHFLASHDDGVTLVIGGLDLGFDPAPTAPVLSDIVYDGPSGQFPFTLIYGECCEAPAVLRIDLALMNGAPEPASNALLGVALTGLGWALRNKEH